jgi:hypothetical protein
MGTQIIGIIIIVAICFGIFLICREVVLWYFKINKIIEGQIKTNTLLERILIQLGGSLDTKPESNVEVEDTNIYDWIDDKGRERRCTTKTAKNAGWTLLKK